jgi:hypothetical protein
MLLDGDSASGRQLATRLCSSCHRVLPMATCLATKIKDRLMGLTITDHERGLLASTVRDTIRTFAEAKFESDVLVSSDASVATSKISSVYKRHGNVLQKAIAVAIGTDPNWKVGNEVELVHPDYPQGLHVDTVLHDGRKLIIFEVKRGLGQHDSDAKKSIAKRLLTAKAEAPQIFKKLKLPPVVDVDCFIVSYYGDKATAKGFKQLTAADVDKMFGPEVSQFIGEVDDYLKFKLGGEIVGNFLGALRELGVTSLSAVEEEVSRRRDQAHSWDSLGT